MHEPVVTLYASDLLPPQGCSCIFIPFALLSPLPNGPFHCIERAPFTSILTHPSTAPPLSSTIGTIVATFTSALRDGRRLRANKWPSCELSVVTVFPSPLDPPPSSLSFRPIVSLIFLLSLSVTVLLFFLSFFLLRLIVHRVQLLNGWNELSNGNFFASLVLLSSFFFFFFANSENFSLVK